MMKTKLSLKMIIGLVLMGLVGISACGREQARRASCASNLRQICYACRMYADDNNGILPDKLSRLYPHYVGSFQIFTCPSTDDKISSPDRIEEDGSYVINVSSLMESGASDKVIAYDKPGNHRGKGRNEVYADGHCQWKATD